MSGAEVQALFARLAEAFAGARDRLGQLDAAVGDGDHGVGMARGFAAAAVAVAEDGDGPGALFTRAGGALMSAVGGASGPLFATIFLEIGKALAADTADPSDPGDSSSDDDAALRISAGLAGAAERIQRLGRSGPGDKTLLEALLPAAEAFRNRAPEGLAAALAAAAGAAERGAQASADLPAQRGRARYVEGAGLGHPDPGAVSIALLFTTWSEGAEGEEGVA